MYCTPGHLSQRNDLCSDKKKSTWMFIVALFTITIWLEVRPMSFSGWTMEQAVAHPCHGILLSNKKGTNYWFTQYPGWMSKELYWVRKINIQSLHTALVYYIPLFQWQNYKHGKHILVFAGFRRGWGHGGMWVWLQKSNVRNPSGDGNVLRLDCVSVNFLVVILCYSFGKGYH